MEQIRMPGPQDGWSLVIDIAHQMFNHMYRVRRGPVSLSAQALMAEPRNRKFMIEYLTEYQSCPIDHIDGLHAALSRIPPKTTKASLKFFRYVDQAHENTIANIVTARDLNALVCWLGKTKSNAQLRISALNKLASHNKISKNKRSFLPYRRGNLIEVLTVINPDVNQIYGMTMTMSGIKILIKFIDNDPRFDINQMVELFRPNAFHTRITVIIDRVTPLMINVTFAKLVVVLDKLICSRACPKWVNCIRNSLIDPARGCVYGNMLLIEDHRIFGLTFREIETLRRQNQFSYDDANFTACILSYIRRYRNLPDLPHDDIVKLINSYAFLAHVDCFSIKIVFNYVKHLQSDIHYQYVKAIINKPFDGLNEGQFIKCSYDIIKNHHFELLHEILELIKVDSNHLEYRCHILIRLLLIGDHDVISTMFKQIMANVFVLSGDNFKINEAMYHTALRVAAAVFGWLDKDTKAYIMKYAMKRGQAHIDEFMGFVDHVATASIGSLHPDQ